MDGRKSWYEASEKDVTELKGIFTEAAQAVQEETGTGRKGQEEENGKETSHFEKNYGRNE